MFKEKKKTEASCLYRLFVGDKSHLLAFIDKFKDVPYDTIAFGKSVFFYKLL